MSFFAIHTSLVPGGQQDRHWLLNNSFHIAQLGQKYCSPCMVCSNGLLYCHKAKYIVFTGAKKGLLERRIEHFYDGYYLLGINKDIILQIRVFLLLTYVHHISLKTVKIREGYCMAAYAAS